jgi:hypothetical protein
MNKGSYYIEPKTCPVCLGPINHYKVYTRKKEFKTVEGVCVVCREKELSLIRSKRKEGL